MEVDVYASSNLKIYFRDAPVDDRFECLSVAVYENTTVRYYIPMTGYYTLKRDASRIYSDPYITLRVHVPK